MIVLLVALWGCHTPTPCDDYSGDARSACIARWARDAATADEAATRCDADPDDEPGCRLLWVESQLRHHDTPRSDLLAFCAGDECALRVLDALPDDDVVLQVSSCTAWAGTLAPDCATHAYARWVVSAPSAATIAEVRELPSPFAERRDKALGHMLGCAHPPSPCPEAYGEACAEGLRQVAARPELCAATREHAAGTESLERRETGGVLDAIGGALPASGLGQDPNQPGPAAGGR